MDNRIITIPGLMGREPKEISEKNLARIIQARVEEIFEYVMWDIHRSGYENKLVAGIVLTGGGSLLKNLELLAEYQTGLAARIGYPTEHLSSHYMDEVSNPMFSTSMGLVFEGMKKMAPIKTEPRKIVSEVFDLVEENVQTTEDLEREEGKREDHKKDDDL